ncbi:MAG: FCD domain-containing protein, partial [Pseudomonadota bacterium]
QSNRQGHLLIADIGANPWYRNWLESLLDEGQRVLRLYMRSLDNHVPTTELKHHHELLEALRARDTQKADDAARADAQIVREQLIHMLSERESNNITLN